MGDMTDRMNQTNNLIRHNHKTVAEPDYELHVKLINYLVRRELAGGN